MTGIAWPAEDAPGTYRITCSCRRWTVTGTAAAINAAARAHDDSPLRSHIVTIRERLT